jgi:preprotein translocase subunit YajC
MKLNPSLGIVSPLIMVILLIYLGVFFYFEIIREKTKEMRKVDEKWAEVMEQCTRLWLLTILN